MFHIFKLSGFAEVWSLLVEGRAGFVVEGRWHISGGEILWMILLDQESLTHFGLSQSNFIQGK